MLAAALHLLNCNLLQQEQQNSYVVASDMLHMQEAFFWMQTCEEETRNDRAFSTVIRPMQHNEHLLIQPAQLFRSLMKASHLS